MPNQEPQTVLLKVRDTLGSLNMPLSVLRSYLAGIAPNTGVTASLVVDAKGLAAGPNGKSDSLTSQIDRAWLLALRSSATTVLTTGKTARAEAYRMPSASQLAIASRTGDLSGTMLTGEASGRLSVFSQLTWHPSWPVGTVAISGAATLAEIALQARALWPSLQIEYGPGGLGQCLALGIIDQLFITAPSEEIANRVFATLLTQAGSSPRNAYQPARLLLDIGALSVFNFERTRLA